MKKQLLALSLLITIPIACLGYGIDTNIFGGYPILRHIVLSPKPTQPSKIVHYMNPAEYNYYKSRVQQQLQDLEQCLFSIEYDELAMQKSRKEAIQAIKDMNKEFAEYEAKYREKIDKE